MQPRRRQGVWGAVAALVSGWLLLVCGGCSPPPLTEEQAASVIRRDALGEVRTTYLNPMNVPGCNDLTRYLVYCEHAGLLTLRWVHRDPPCGRFEIELTERGEQYFADLEYEGDRSLLYTTKGWRVGLRQPITARLVELIGIEDVDGPRTRVRYTWQADYPPALENCTRHSQRGIHEAEAFFRWSGGEWKLD